MFNFRLINTADGNQIIDPTLKTPYNSLTADQMIEYIEMDKQLIFMKRMNAEKKYSKGKCKLCLCVKSFLHWLSCL